MTITPRFNLSQTDSHVSVEIRVPHIRVSAESVEVLVEDDHVLHFSSPPYLLVLRFPSPIVENEAETAKYDPLREGGMINIELEKLTPMFWPDLDMTARLMQDKDSSSVGPLRVSVVSQESFDEADSNDEKGSFCETERSACLRDDIVDRPHYGFANQFYGIFVDLGRSSLVKDMLQLEDPDETSEKERRRLRRRAELEDFDEDRYLGDLNVEEDYIYQCALSMDLHWSGKDSPSVDSLTRQLSTLSTNDETEPITVNYFTEDERQQLASLSYPLLDFNLSDNQRQRVLCCLLDLLFAYVYDHLVTQGDPTVESSWTITTLSCSLSWLDSSSETIQNVVRQSLRRSLSYPYIRNFDFGMHCWKQVGLILSNGRRCVIRCLLRMRSILHSSEFHYLGNKLFVDPYLAWLQKSAADSDLIALRRDLDRIIEVDQTDVRNMKKSLRLNLLKWERLLDSTEEESTSDESTSDESTSDESTSDDSEIDSDEKVKDSDCEENRGTHHLAQYDDGRMGKESCVLSNLSQSDNVCGRLADADLSTQRLDGDIMGAKPGSSQRGASAPLIQEIS